MKTRYVIIIIVLFVFVLLGTTGRTSSAGIVSLVDQTGRQTSDTAICTDVVSRLLQDTIMVETVIIAYDKAGKIFFYAWEPDNKKLLGGHYSFVSFKKYVELHHKDSKILQVHFNFELDNYEATIFYEKLRK